MSQRDADERQGFDFLPLSVRVETLGGISTMFIRRGTRLPATRTQTFTTAADEQSAIEVRLQLGESPLAKRNHTLLQATLTGIECLPKGEPQIKTTVTVDRDCRVTLVAVEERSESTLEETSSEDQPVVTRALVNRLVKRARVHRVRDEGEALLVDAERFLNNVGASGRGPKSERIDELAAALGVALQNDDEADIAAKTEELERELKKPVEVPDYGNLFGSFFGGPSTTVFGRTTPAPGTRQAETRRGKAGSRAPAPSDRGLEAVRGYDLGRIFGGANHPTDQKLVFVLMPFGGDFDDLYADHIKAAVEAAGLRPLRADEIFTPTPIMGDIWRSICRARLVIADLTGRNPNVFYEVGLAHAIGKEVILLTQSMNDVPFDLRGIRSIVYDFSPRGATKLVSDLRKAIPANS